MIKIEVLYPEYMNLYGDNGNLKYLEAALDKVEFIYTNLNDKPGFLSKKIDMLYLGPCTESNQEEIATLLKPYKDKIEALIESDVLILAIGNALELFGEYIEKSDGTKIEGLGLFDVYAKRFSNRRHNELCLGKTNTGLEMVGFKNQMSHLYGKDEHYFLKMILGTGRNTEGIDEGIFYHNFIGTYLLGPILPLNPYFTKEILAKLKVKNLKLPFEETAFKAYNLRLDEFKKLIKGQ